MTIEQLTGERDFQGLYARLLVKRFHGKEFAFNDAFYTACINNGLDAIDNGNLDLACDMRRIASEERARRARQGISTLDDVYSNMFARLHNRIIEKQTETIMYKH